MKPLITLSSRALLKLKTILKTENKSSILFYLNSGGCNGFEYNFKPVDMSINKEHDLHIQDDLEVYICGKSTMYVLGTHIDWKEDIMGQEFIFDNPNAKSMCGCGTSFDPIIKA